MPPKLQPSTKSNLTLAEQALKGIKLGTSKYPRVLSTHDVIPRSTGLKSRVEITALYGKDRVQDLDKLSSQIELVRKKIVSNVQSQTNIPYPLSTINVAISLCGFGECGETSTRAVIDLLIDANKNNYHIALAIVVGLGQCKLPITGREPPSFFQDFSQFYNHAFVIIGDSIDFSDKYLLSSEFKSEFSGLKKTNILLDPSLGRIGLAKEVPNLLKDIFEAYKIDRIGGVEYFDSELHGNTALTIFENALKIAKIVREELKLDFVVTSRADQNPPVSSSSPTTTAVGTEVTTTTSSAILSSKIDTPNQPPERIKPLIRGAIRFYDVRRTSEELLKQTLEEDCENEPHNNFFI